jgi:hypothetical protein
MCVTARLLDTCLFPGTCFAAVGLPDYRDPTESPTIGFRMKLSATAALRVCERAAFFTLFCISLRADPVTVVLAGSHIVSVSAGGSFVPSHELVPGRSVGEVSDPLSFPAAAADNLNLATYFAREMVGDPTWTVDLGPWRDRNGAAADFFLFELGGNDSVSVRCLLGNGSLGVAVPLAGWTPTGYTVSHGPNAGQQVYGLAFSSAQLRDAAGQVLGPGVTIEELRFASATIDGAAFAAVSRIPPSPAQGQDGDAGLEVWGELHVWHPLELRLRGPWASELDDAPNPFLDYRMQATFTAPSGRTTTVQGFFDGDGDGGGEGTVFKARFAPDEAGPWTVRVSFRGAPDVAIDLSPHAGFTLAPWDGVATSFHVARQSPLAPGFLAEGRLEYVGEHYMRFREGRRFLKAGADSPENFLAYFGFDDTVDAGGVGILHRYAPHVADFNPGDPHFSSNCSDVDSKGIIGALNYLGEQGVNSIYVLPMNLGGDGQDTFPFVGVAPTEFDKTHYDVGRLHQWNVVLEHAQRQGIAVHFVLAETEPGNETWLDNGLLGRERKLFFRELAARFGHLLALKWNLCEENDYPLQRLQSFADYLDAVDPYDHGIAFHNHLNQASDYQSALGDPRFCMTSVQYHPDQANLLTEDLRGDSAAAGWPWIVDMDENAPAGVGLSDTNAADLRKRVLWDVYLSGGQVEWYMGEHPLPVGGDHSVEDFRTREPMWTFMRHAHTLMNGLPFWRMQPADELLINESTAFGGGQVFYAADEVYVVYLPRAQPSGFLDLSSAPGRLLRRRWHDPRTGQWAGAGDLVRGGGVMELGSPPALPLEDWVVVLSREDARHQHPDPSRRR